MLMRFSRLTRFLCIFLICALPLTGCASFVVISEPYHLKLRVGDGVKLLTKDGTIHSGRITYIDRGSIVLRTPKQTAAERPVEVARFGTTIPWSEVVKVKVSGTLDSQGRLVSKEEMRINRRSNQRRNLAVNIGLLSLGASFLTAVYVQDRISPPTIDVSSFKHNQGRAAFWSTFVLGSIGGALAGYKLGEYLDNKNAIKRIERARLQTQKAVEVLSDSLRQKPSLTPLFTPQSPQN